MKSRLLLLLEAALNRLWVERWVSSMPGWFEEIWAGVILVVINAIRRVRFGNPPHGMDCEQCGLFYPTDDLRTRIHADGSPYAECVGCGRFMAIFRSIHSGKPRAA